MPKYTTEESYKIAQLWIANAEKNRSTRLSLESLNITELPPELNELINLTSLKLSSNNLTRLPINLKNLTNLEWLDLRNNPDLPIPDEILNDPNTPQAILDYYFNTVAPTQETPLPPAKERHTEEKEEAPDKVISPPQPLNEAKLVLVGQGSVGKTSLIKRLINNEFDPDENKTEGIQITNWPVKTSGDNVKLRVWDFGGQEIMHATHQFFLTRRSLYLLVLDARIDEAENRIEYWLKTIQTFAEDSPVIIVGNKTDQQPLDIDERGILAKYPLVRAILQTSANTGKGINDLRKEIQSALDDMPHIRDLLPGAWFNVKQELERLQQEDNKNTITYTQYAELCEQMVVDIEQSQEALVSFLHDLGIALHFRDQGPLQTTQVLNPGWVTDGVYKIINDKLLMEKLQGVLNPKDLKRILNIKGYKRPDQQTFITEIMRRFELSHTFQIKGKPHHLIPSLLSKEAPDGMGEWKDSLGFEYHYNLLPASLISRFIVRLFPYIQKKLYWRSGAVLTQGDNQALVRADQADNTIRVKVRGHQPTQRQFLAILRHEMEAINRTFNLEIQEMVPVPGHPDIYENYDHLLNLEDMGVTDFVPRGVKKRVAVQPLLEGYENAASRARRRQAQEDPDLPDWLQDLQSIASRDLIFISYAHLDETPVLNLYQELSSRGYNLWLDKRDILPGQKWEREIEKAVKRSAIFLAVLSENSYQRRGVLQQEIGYALENMTKNLLDDIHIIPLRLEEVEYPEKMEKVQGIDWFKPGERDQLYKSLDLALDQYRNNPT